MSADEISSALASIENIPAPTKKRSVGKKATVAVETGLDRVAPTADIPSVENPVVAVSETKDYETLYWTALREIETLRAEIAVLKNTATEKIGFREKDTHTRIDSNTGKAVETKYLNTKIEYATGTRMLGCSTKQKNNSAKYTKVSTKTYYEIFKKGIAMDINTKIKYPIRGDTICVVDSEGNTDVLKLMVL